MDKSEELFFSLAHKLSKRKDVTLGSMMRCGGIRYKNKVFAFYTDDGMVFRLGKAFDPKTFSLKNWKHLNPFKHKPAMKAWFVIDKTESKKWEKLAVAALEQMKKEVK